jgi:HlyD family secretion protein
MFNRMTTELLRPVALERPGVELPPAPPGSSRRHRVLIAILVGLAVVGLVVWVIVARHRGKTEALASDATGTARVERRDFIHSLRLTGTTEAVQSRAVLVPQLSGQNFGEMVITKLAAAGAKVKQGDVLVEFDRQGQIKQFLDKQVEYHDLVDQVAKKRADEEAARAKDETELKQAEDDLKKAELEMLKNEISSRIQAEKNRQTLDAASANLKALRETFDLKRRAAQADIRVLEIQSDRSKETMLHAQKNENEMTVRSPMDGVAVLNTIWKEGKMGEVQEGDQVRPGQSILQVINPAAMQIRVNVNQADLLRLRPGQQARARLDAYPQMVFPATLDELDPIGKNGRFSDTVRTFTALFSIQGSDPKLMPDLSAAVDVELERAPNALLVPRDSVATENGQSYVRARRGLGFEKRAVKLGPENDVEAVIESGLRAGDVVERNLGM